MESWKPEAEPSLDKEEQLNRFDLSAIEHMDCSFVHNVKGKYAGAL